MANLFENHFTLDQANQLIPHVRRLFSEVRALVAPPTAPLSNFKPAGHGGPHTCGNGNGKATANGNGHAANAADEDTAEAADYSDWTEEKRHEAAYRLLNALQSQGIVIQDVDRGLIDFPAIVNGNEVFLCYELSDGPSIEFFHEIEAGYAGRKPITEINE